MAGSCVCASQGTWDNGARSACPLVMVIRARAEEPAPSPTTPSTASAMRGGKVRERERETGGREARVVLGCIYVWRGG